MKAYRRRIADDILRRKLRMSGGVLVEGMKWCGKTTTAEIAARSALYVSKPDEIKNNLMLADIDPAALLNGDTPRLIDEWQVAPKLWDAARYEIDRRGLAGQFIFTGSSVPVENDSIVHTGTGRFARLRMRTMSLFESGDSIGSVSLKGLFDGESFATAECSHDLSDVAYLICRGGWPGVLNLDRSDALYQAFEYFDAVVNVDISHVDGVRRSPDRAKRLMRSYARNQGAQVSYSTIRSDIASNDVDSMTEDTIFSYADALRKIFVIEDITAWNPNLRSKSAIRSSDTRYFADPSIAVASLGLGPKDLENDLNTMGLFFETLCVRDLRIYSQAIDGEVYHFRDKTGLEVDAVVHLRNGSYGLIEIKLGGDRLIDEAAGSLKALRDRLDVTKMRSPSFLMVLCAVGKYAFKRSDGVLVVPIGCLKD